jgi:uncharacterized protein YoxC
MAEPRAEVTTTVIGLLKHLNLTADEILAVVQGLNMEPAEIISMLSTLTADVTWDTSVTYHAVQDVGAAVASLAAQVAGLAPEVAALQADLDGRLDAMEAQVTAIYDSVVSPGPPTPGPPVGVTLSLANTSDPPGGPMSTDITVDTQNEVLVLAFTDDFSNVTTAPTAADGSAAVLTGTTDTSDVATVGSFALAADGTYQAPITPGGTPGLVNLGATVQDSSGNDIPLPNPAAGGPATFTAEAGTVALQVNPGAPVGDRLSLA